MTQHRLVDWFQRWRTPLRRFLASRSAIRPADLDDVAQEVFLRLLRYDAARIVEHLSEVEKSITKTVLAKISKDLADGNTSTYPDYVAQSLEKYGQ